MESKIGFMGLGIMGAPMAARILKADYPLMVYNRTAAKAESPGAIGGRDRLQPQGPGQEGGDHHRHGHRARGPL